jgi:RHS repeat-associated protein
MGIDAMPQPGSAAQLGSELQGNGELCWVAQVTSTTGTCGNPGGSSTNYETVAYNSSGDMTGTTASGYGTTSALTWNVDTNQPTCINPSATGCTEPSASQPAAQTYAYNADGLRATEKTWSSSTSSVVTTAFTWNTGPSALLSNGTFDYLYGLNPNVPIAQIDSGNGITGQLLTDPSGNVRGIVEVSSGGANPFVLGNYTDYDVYGNPITGSGGSLNAGGLTVDGKSGDGDTATSYGFGGGYLDATSLTYLVHRYYDAIVGQFLSVDSMVTSTESPYAYASDSPITSVDPLGLKKVPDTWNLTYRSTPSQWSAAILHDLHLRTDRYARWAFDAWLEAEQANGWSPSNITDWNVLGFTGSFDGAIPTPPVGVLSFQCAGDGERYGVIFLKTFQGGRYYKGLQSVFHIENPDPPRRLGYVLYEVLKTPLFQSGWGSDYKIVQGEYNTELSSRSGWVSSHEPHGWSNCDPSNVNMGGACVHRFN